jgi:hypothetical protein
MSKNDIIRKLTSRKLWIAVAGLVSSIMIAAGCPEQAITQVTACITAAASVIAYIIGEGLVDAARASGEQPTTQGEED